MKWLFVGGASGHRSAELEAAGWIEMKFGWCAIEWGA